MLRSKKPRQRVLTFVGFLLCIAALVGVGHRPQRVRTKEILQQAEALNFSGVLGVRRGGETILALARGYANEELQAPMGVSNVFGIASNSKLFATVALYQLEEQGKVALDTAVNPYLSNWCPKVNGTGPCRSITFHQMLGMSSGIVDAFNCDNVAFSSPYCVSFDSVQWYLYKGSIKPYVDMFISSPLIFEPGTQYSYSNPNFILAAYLVEQISGQSFQAYLEEHIFQPLQLESTAFDPRDGQIHIQPNYVDSYNHFYDNHTMESLSIGSCRPYLTLGGFNGAGGLTSTPFDLMRWYEDLFSTEQPSILLTPASIQQIVKPWTLINGTSYYGQGVFVDYQNDQLDKISYCGELKCTFSCISIQDNVIATAFTNHGHILVEATAFEKELAEKGVDTMIRTGRAVQKLGGAREMLAYLIQNVANV